MIKRKEYIIEKRERNNKKDREKGLGKIRRKNVERFGEKQRERERGKIGKDKAINIYKETERNNERERREGLEKIRI